MDSLNNRIYIDVNYIKNATSAYKKQSLKETLGHEAVHMLQNKFKIFEKILSLPPKDGLSLYLLMELDATMKSYIACDKYYNTNTEERANSTFNAITNVVNYAMNSYIKKAMLIYKNKTFNPNVPNTKDVIELNGTYTSSGKAITVKKSLTFNGVNGATLDGKKLSGIFYIPANATVTFNNIKFINATVTSDGGYAGVLAGQVTGNTTISGITVEKAKVTTSDLYAGVIFGAADGAENKSDYQATPISR